MKKSVAITTIIAFHAALIGGMLIQAGCSSEPSDAQPAKAKSTVEEINPSQKEEAQSAEEAQKEVIPPEGSAALRVPPTRPTWNMSGDKNAEVVTPEKTDKADKAKETVAPAEPVKPAEANGTPYTVQKGDSLAKIAKKHKVSLDKLLKANGMNRSTMIQVGQEISIPASEADANAAVVPAAPVAPQMESVVESEEMVVYIVRKGDSLGRIARKNKTTIKHLMDINNLKNHNIRIGQKLNVSKKGAAALAASDSAQPSSEKASVSRKSKKPVAGEGEVEHTVKSGETLGAIAIKYKSSVKAIMERNSIKDARKLRVGQVIVIASKNGAAKKAEPAKTETLKPQAPKTAEPSIPVISDAPKAPTALGATATSATPVVQPTTTTTTVAPSQPNQISTENLPVEDL